MPNKQFFYRLGDWLVEPHLNRVSKEGLERRLEPRAMDVLSYLLEQTGQVVSTGELLDHCWGKSKGEPGLVAKRLSQIREALGDSARKPLFIETIPRRGYRIVAPVSRFEGEPPQFIVAPRKSSPIRSIAVLPLHNHSGTSGTSGDDIAESLTEELVTEFGRLPGLRVVSHSFFAQGGRKIPTPRKFAKEVGAEALVTGSVTREDGRLRLTVQLLDGDSGTQLWAETFDREFASLLTLRADLAREVAQRIRPSLTGRAAEEQSGQREKVDPRAYDAYLRGLSLMKPAYDPAEALDFFRLAVTLDPQFAEAWTWLALIGLEWAMDDRTRLPKVRLTAEKALAVEPSLGEARTVLGLVRLLYDWDTAGASREFELAAQHDPNHPFVLFGQFINARHNGRFEESVRVCEVLLPLVSRDPLWRGVVATHFYIVRLYDRSISEAAQIRQLDPSFFHEDEAEVFEQLGLFHESHKARIAFYRRRGKPFTEVQQAVERGWARAHYEGALRARLAHELALQPPKALTISELYARLGENELAFSWLERAFEDRVPRMIELSFHPSSDLLRCDPRFDQMLERVGLPPLAESPARTADVARWMAFRGRSAEAVLRLNQVIAESNPEEVRLSRWLDSLAWAHFAEGDYKLAALRAEEALEQEVSPHAAAVTYFLIAASYAQLEKLEPSRKAYSAALESWPTTFDFDRDILPLFLGGNTDLKDRYLAGLRRAGLGTD